MKSYAIANLAESPDEGFFLRVTELARAGVDYLQLRVEGGLTDRQILAVAGECRARLRSIAEFSGSFIVSRRADIALAVDAAGVHLPSRGLSAAAVRAVSPGLRVGRSCHSVEDVRRAAAEKMDYVLLGPVFETRSKIGRAEVTIGDLTAASRLGVPIYALGGLSLQRAADLRDAGVAGVAGVTMFMSDPDPAATVEALRAI